VAKDTDLAGNTGTSSAVVFTLQTAAPTVSITSAGVLTSVATQTISGIVTATQAAVGTTVTLYDNGSTTPLGTATVGSGGVWSTSVMLSGDGNHSIVAKDTDAAGNVGNSAPVVFRLATTTSTNVQISPPSSAPYTVPVLPGTTVTVNSLALSDPNATLLDEGSLTIVGSLILTAGFLEIENGGTLSLGGSSSFTADFVGTGGNLVLASSPGFTGTITALSNATGPVTITGSGAVTTSGDATDLTASGGTQGNPANLNVNLTGPVTGAATGISVIQNAFGSITVATSGPVIGQVGQGIFAEENTTGTGSILINGSGDVTGTGDGISGIVAENLDTADSSNVTVSQTGNITGGYDGIRAQTSGSGNVIVSTGTNATITGLLHYGIEALSNGIGNVSVTTALGDVISSGSVGIDAYNQATSIPQTSGVTTSSVSVAAYGTINSGSLLTGYSSRPAGILAGYRGGTTNTVNAAVYGNVTVDNFANINAAGGDGIRAYNFGSGNITVTDHAGTTITTKDQFGIEASSYGTGQVTVTTAAGDIITAGSYGIQAINLATAIPVAAASSVNVTAYGIIHAGFHLSPGAGKNQGISAGYYPNNGVSDTSVNGTVSIDNFANVTSDNGWGIDTYNWGNGSVTLTDEAGTSVSGAQYGITASSLSTGTGSFGSVTINVLANATVTAGTGINAAGINANEHNGGNIAITTAAGDIINSGGSGIQAGDSSTTATTASQISITARGTINSGFSGFSPAGINAGYGAGNTILSGVAGNVFVDDYAAINAASGWGINLYNFGTGNLSATLEAGATVAGAAAGLNVYAQGGGNVTIANSGTVTDVTGSGISTGTGTGSTGNGLPGNATGHGVISITNSGAITALGAGNSAVVQIGNFSANAAVFTNTGTVTANMLSSGLSVAISNYAGTIATNNGGVTINNNSGGTISGDVALWSSFLVATSTFNNATGAIWNINGSNGFASATSAINNSGTINIAGNSGFYVSTGIGAALAFKNSGAVNIQTGGFGYIGGPVSAVAPLTTGLFLIGDRAGLEFASAVDSTQTVSFVDGKGTLTLDNPAAFAGTISGLTFGDTLDLFGGVIISSASVDPTGTTLTVTESNSQTLTYKVANFQAGARLDVLSTDKITVVPTAANTITGQTIPYFASPASQTSYIFAADAIAGTTTGIGISASDSTSTDTIATIVNQTSSVAVSGTNINGINVTTTGASIAIVNAAQITSSGGVGIKANSGAGNGSIDLIDYGNVSGGQVGIQAGASGLGPINVVVGAGATVTGATSSTTSSGIIAISGQGSSSVTTLPGVTINSGRTGIFAENQASSVPLANNSSIVVTTSGTINSGQGKPTSGGEPAGILAAYIGGTSAPSTIPNPPLAGIFGNVIVNNNANINATSGTGISAFNYGTGNVSVSDGSGATITATAAGTTTSGFAQYGIFAFNYGSGNTSVATAFGSSIVSGGTGINAGNQATAIAAAASSTLTVDALGTIHSGANLNNSGSAPSGIQAGYNPGNLGVFNSGVAGNVLVIDGGNTTADAGDGINAYNYGVGNIAVDVGFGVSIQALTAASSSGGNAPYGIGAFNYGTGNISVTTSSGDSINSGSTGINAVNEATAIAAAAGALVTINSFGSINSGTILTNSGAQPSGLSAGFLGGTNGGAANLAVNGTVIVNNDANITAAAGIGINAYNYGNGDITVNDASATTVSGVQYGIDAHAEGGTGTNAPTGNIAVNVAANATVNSTAGPGILAFSTDVGNISVVTSSGDVITAGGAGINAVNEQATIAASANSWISVTAAGTINSGTALTGTGKEPGGVLAGYLGGSVIPTTLPINIHGEVVVNNSATINAAGGDGIRAYNYGIGNVTVNEFSGTITALDASSLTPAGYGIGIAAVNYGSGDISVNMTAGTINSGGSGIVAVNQAASSTALPSVPSTSIVSVLAYGTINSGSITTNTTAKDPAAGILAGYNPNNADTVDANVHGNVVIDDYASIAAPTGTDGIRGVNYGTGTITAIIEAGTVISAGRYGLAALAYDGGDVSVTNYASVTGATAAIDALSTSTGTVFIDNYGTITGDVISGSATFHNESGATWNLSGSSTFAGTSQLINAGTIDTTGASSITTTGALNINNTGTVNVQSGTFDVAAAVTGTGSFTIGSGAQLELGSSVASGTTVVFQNATGTLKLDDPAHFAGQISGLSGTDGIDLVGFSSASAVVTPVSTTASTVLTVADATHTVANGTAASISLQGNYTQSSFTFTNDISHTGILIVDPPSTTASNTTIVATGTNQALTGTGANDNFVFNFAAVGQDTVTNFHTDTDLLQLKASMFANVQAILVATHDDGHGNTVIALDDHDSITLAGVLKSQLHTSDFHLA
jgi:hypothetical protein